MTPFYLALMFAIVTLSIAILLGVLVYYRRKAARDRRAFHELAQRIPGTDFRKSMYLGDLLEGQYGGISFTCRHFMGSKNSPPALTIQVRVSCPATLKIRRETWYDRFAKRIGLAAEIQTGDPGFDQVYFIDTDREDIFQPYLLQEAKRREIDALFSLGFPVREIVFGENDLRVVLAPLQGDVIASVPVETYLDALITLSEGLFSAGYPLPFNRLGFPGSPRTRMSRAGLVLLFITNAFLILGGAVALAYGMNRYEPLGNRMIIKALAFSAPAALVFLFLVFRWMRGRSSSHRLFPFVLIFSLIGFPLALTGGAVTTNGFLDQGGETPRQVLVTKRYYRQNKSNRTYYVAFPSWQHPNREDRISVSADLFRAVRLGDGIVIRTKPGYWQEEWIAGIERAPIASSRAEASTGIPLRLLSIRFYEGGFSNVLPKDRRFAAEFARETSRFIFCQLDMENNLWQEMDRLYTFGWQYVNPDGSLRAEISLPFTIRKQWKTAWVSRSWGWKMPGHWPRGNYRVMVLVDGRPLGEGTFTIR